MTRPADPAEVATRRALRVLAAALSPVLSLRGFAAGVAGSGQLLFCAPTADLLSRSPGVPGRAPHGECVDVLVDVDAGTLSAARVETAQLAGLLRARGTLVATLIRTSL